MGSRLPPVTPLASLCARTQLLAAEAGAGAGAAALRVHRSAAKVAIASCRSYGPEVGPALGKCFDLLGGIGSLVRNKTVTVKLNLTGDSVTPYPRPAGSGETYITHYATRWRWARCCSPRAPGGCGLSNPRKAGTCWSPRWPRRAGMCRR